jgi:Ribbon-helix-helix protein, copG family
MLPGCRKGDIEVSKKESGSRFDNLFKAVKPEQPTPSVTPSEAVGDRTLSKGKDPGYQRTTIYIPKDLHKRLKTAALEDDREMSDIIEELIEQWLASRRSDA